MKAILTLLLSLFLTICIAQDKTYVHEATAANTSLNGTVINHPDLNSNPDAKIVFSNRYVPAGGVLNNHVTGLWYRVSDGRWLIFNEDFAISMVVGTLFTIFIADQAEVFTHVASIANQGTSNSNTLLDHPLLNGQNPGPIAIFSNYFNPNEVYNNFNHGFSFDTTIFNNRLVYNEGFTPIPENSAFKIMVIPPGGVAGVSTFGHLSSVANSSGFSTTLDHPSLNDNSDAAFVFSHYYGAFGAQSNNNINKVLGALYDTTVGRWKIFTEDLTAMPVGVAFDIVVADQEILGVHNNDLTMDVSMFPNPASSFVTISTLEVISSVILYNIVGQELLNLDGEGRTLIKIDLSSFSSGNYLAKVQIGDSNQTLKLIKL